MAFIENHDRVDRRRGRGGDKPHACRRVLAAAMLAQLLAAAVSAQCSYSYVEIPNPPGWRCAARAVNEQGWVAGYADNLGDLKRAFIWRPETGTVVLPLPPGYNSQAGYAMNDLGHVVGSLGGSGANAFYWDGTTTTIIHYPAWANGITAYGVNNRGQVVGVMTNSLTGPLHAFLWEDGVLTDLTPNVDSAKAWGINDRGVIVGTLGASTAVRAFIIDESGFHELDQPEPLVGSEGLALNNNGMVVGIVLPIAEIQHPDFRKLGAVWDGELTDIVDPPPTSRDVFFRAVNDAGRAVGEYERTLLPVVWQHGVIQDLRTLIVPSQPVEEPAFRYAATSCRALDISSGGLRFRH